MYLYVDGVRDAALYTPSITIAATLSINANLAPPYLWWWMVLLSRRMIRPLYHWRALYGNLVVRQRTRLLSQRWETSSGPVGFGG